jgi:hypothetical protein
MHGNKLHALYMIWRYTKMTRINELACSIMERVGAKRHGAEVYKFGAKDSGAE